jgi:transketolase
MSTLNAVQVRKLIIDMAYCGSTVHIGCAFSIVEILVILYRDFLNYPNNDLSSAERDYLVLSKGHGVMAQYACMNLLGFLSHEHIENYFSDGTELKGLSDSRIPGLEVTSGSLGHGFSVGVGMALASKMKNSSQKTYVIVGDGELNEGPIWEGALFASHHQLNNLMIIIDENGLQAMGKTEDIIALNDINQKFSSFGFDAVTIDGHNEELLKQTIQELWTKASNRPKAIIAKTIKGKGVSFMENDNIWHYTRLSEDAYRRALLEVVGDGK